MKRYLDRDFLSKMVIYNEKEVSGYLNRPAHIYEEANAYYEVMNNNLKSHFSKQILVPSEAKPVEILVQKKKKKTDLVDIGGL